MLQLPVVTTRKGIPHYNSNLQRISGNLVKLYNTIQYNTILYYTILYYAILYYMIINC